MNYFHGQGYALTKTGANEIDFNNTGDTGLGDINIQEGSLKFLGNSTMGASGAVNLSGNSRLEVASDATIAHVKQINVAATGGQVIYTSGDGTLGGMNLSGAVTIDNAVPLEIDGAIGDGALVKSATANTLTLTGTLNSIATVTINGGTLAVESGSAGSLGAISGTGTLVVGATAHSTSLTTPSIAVTTLSIGGPGTAAAVPEPSTALLLVIGLIGAIGWYCHRKDC